MFQRMIVVGFLRLVPISSGLIRLQLGLLATLVYLILLLYLRPFKRNDQGERSASLEFAAVASAL